MRYLLAIILPPVAMFTVGKPFQAILCLLLMVTLIGWPLAAIWALLVVHSAFADTRAKKLVEEQRRTREAMEAQTRLLAEQQKAPAPAAAGTGAGEVEEAPPRG
jgi:uncharacterized membrane protein YqaE (UPF0057 family)